MVPKTRLSTVMVLGVGERSICAEAVGVTRGGVYGSENVGMSNRNVREIRTHRKSKVSRATAIIPG